VQIAERFQTSHFDAQILAAAKRLGCTTVYSEDLNLNPAVENLIKSASC